MATTMVTLSFIVGDNSLNRNLVFGLTSQVNEERRVCLEHPYPSLNSISKSSFISFQMKCPGAWELKLFV